MVVGMAMLVFFFNFSHHRSPGLHIERFETFLRNSSKEKLKVLGKVLEIIHAKFQKVCLVLVAVQEITKGFNFY